MINAQWLDTHDWMISSDDNGWTYDRKFHWPETGTWTSAPDWNPAPVCGGGFHGMGKEAHGFGFSFSRFVLRETRGERIVIDANKIKVREARIVAVNDDIPTEAFAACGYTRRYAQDGATISPQAQELWIVKTGTVIIAEQTGGYCWAYDRAVINIDASQTGGDCWAYDRAVINSRER